MDGRKKEGKGRYMVGGRRGFRRGVGVKKQHGEGFWKKIILYSVCTNIGIGVITVSLIFLFFYYIFSILGGATPIPPSPS